MNLMKDILHSRVLENEVAIFWLGQAGFLIKDHFGRIITIDPYLTDCCERIFGFKRLSPKLVSASELITDILFSTHSHLDHFDVDAIPLIMANKDTQFIGSKTAVDKCRALGIEKEKLTAIEEKHTFDLGWARFEAVYADHGEMASDAIGVIIYMQDLKIYFTGDTAYRPEKMKDAIDANPDVIVLPINGAYGNLNEHEAAMLARDTHAKIAVPCHFWTFSTHGGDPEKFANEIKNIAPECAPRFLCQGEGFRYPV